MPFDSVGGNDPSMRPSNNGPRPVEMPAAFTLAVWLTAGVLCWAVVGLVLANTYNGLKSMLP
jgi:hypothetical protein